MRAHELPLDSPYLTLEDKRLCEGNLTRAHQSEESPRRDVYGRYRNLDPAPSQIFGKPSFLRVLRIFLSVNLYVRPTHCLLSLWSERLAGSI